MMQCAITQSYAQIDRHYIINIRPSVDYDCEIGDYVHVAHHAIVLGGVKVGEGFWIGVGSVVLRDVPDEAIVVGCLEKR